MVESGVFKGDGKCGSIDETVSGRYSASTSHSCEFDGLVHILLLLQERFGLIHRTKSEYNYTGFRIMYDLNIVNAGSDVHCVIMAPWPLFVIQEGDVAQMVERMLSMHEARGSIPRFSTLFVLAAGTSHWSMLIFCSAGR